MVLHGCPLHTSNPVGPTDSLPPMAPHPRGWQHHHPNVGILLGSHLPSQLHQLDSKRWVTAKPPGKQTRCLVILYKVLNTEELTVKMLEKLKEQLEERETSLRLTTARSHHHLWGRKWRYQSQELGHLGASGTVEETEPLLETRVKQRGRKYPASPFLPPYNLPPVTPIDQT